MRPLYKEIPKLSTAEIFEILQAKRISPKDIQDMLAALEAKDCEIESLRQIVEYHQKACCWRAGVLRIHDDD